MQYSRLDPARSARHIVASKVAVMLEMRGTGTDPAQRLPLPFAIYLALFSRAGAEPIGLAEGYLLRDAYRAQSRCALFDLPEVRSQCAFGQTAFIQTLYLPRDLRGRSLGFAYLALGLAHQLHQRAATYANAATAAHRIDLIRLYARSGGHLLGRIAAPDYGSESIVVIGFALSQLLAHTSAARSRRRLECA